MTSIDRRTFLAGGAAGASLILMKNLMAQAALNIDDEKRRFIAAANQQWTSESEIEAVAAKEREKHGEFASLSPPQQLIPFKDWDFYYLKGKLGSVAPESRPEVRACRSSNRLCYGSD